MSDDDFLKNFSDKITITVSKEILRSVKLLIDDTKDARDQEAMRIITVSDYDSGMIEKLAWRNAALDSFSNLIERLLKLK